jgi:hypothetical protein
MKPMIKRQPEYYGLEILAGKQIIDARWDGDSIFLNCSNEEHIQLEPYGDCCANCFICNVDGAEALSGASIIEVEDLDLPLTDDDVNDDYTTTDVWGHRLKTDKGICTIEMRVIHNGYYGGSLNVYSSRERSEAPLLLDF